MTTFFSVTRKVALGYLVILLFSLLASGYALVNLHDHNRRTGQLVGVQFRAFTLLRDTRQNLLAQENLVKQLAILKDPQLLGLLERRVTDFEEILEEVKGSALPDYFSDLPDDMVEYRDQLLLLQSAFAAQEWDLAANLSTSMTSPLRSQLLEALTNLRARHQTALDKDLNALSLQTGEAYRLTLIITLVGILLSAPVALTVIIGIHRSVRALKQATREVAAGSFGTPIDIRSNDEFGQLAKDFSEMGCKLAELEQLRLDANPLTRLPGNLAIDRELERRIADEQPFAHLYIDLDNFKAYSDHYGYKSGSNAIHLVGNLLKEVVAEHGGDGDLVGHIGGDDYVVLTTPRRAERLAKTIIGQFDAKVPDLYDAEDLKAGFIIATDRQGFKRTFPLLTVSIAITVSENLDQPSLLSISHNCATMKSHLKRLKGSNYLIDRRKQIA